MVLFAKGLVALSACFALAGSARAWSPSIHGVISLSAFESLTEDQQVELINLLRRHPQFQEMIAAPEGSDLDLEREIIILRASTWPDRVAGTAYDRPSWHFADGLRNPSRKLVDPPPEVDLPSDAAQRPHELNMLQAIRLSLDTFANADNPEAERAIALCWTMNLLADRAQPLRLLSLQAPPTFEDGDDHAREIRVAGVTLFDKIERYPSRSEDIRDVLAVKEQFQSHAEWERLFTGSKKWVKRATDGKAALNTAVITASTLYLPVADDIDEALAEGAAAPLQLGPKGFYKRVLPDFLPRLAADAAGTLAAVLEESF